ncbi:LOW QUALITY PROTEIN: hypothetical protein QYF61_016399 [Mycteria americana]|uniref:Uncharacterized protein n=1 Tax=Mycteria americana TaxID=33587 RepID=A0AAN7RXG2_MYCAM|nr:LOW QUALITY PROTEIN: hypothetical protein QYF61_016399 [Mycteria americana]
MIDRNKDRLISEAKSVHATSFGILCHKGTLLAHIQLSIHQDTQVFFCKAAFQLVGPQPVLVHGIIPPQVQDLALPLVELHEVPPISPLVEVPLNVSTTIWYISNYSHFSMICRLAEGSLCPIIQVMNEVIKQYWSQC